MYAWIYLSYIDDSRVASDSRLIAYIILYYVCLS